jgi:hypothetical protein
MPLHARQSPQPVLLGPVRSLPVFGEKPNASTSVEAKGRREGKSKPETRRVLLASGYSHAAVSTGVSTHQSATSTGPNHNDWVIAAELGQSLEHRLEADRVECRSVILFALLVMTVDNGCSAEFDVRRDRRSDEREQPGE